MLPLKSARGSLKSLMFDFEFLRPVEDLKNEKVHFFGLTMLRFDFKSNTFLPLVKF